MTDTTIRVSKETRQRLGSWAELRDLTQGGAIEELLDRVDAPEVPESDTGGGSASSSEEHE